MTISAKIIADSINPQGDRLTTMVIRYPRFIHAEFMTHRVFSRNASSSRAIPVQKMIDAVKDDPAMPVFWGRNQSGMQAAEELTGVEKTAAMGAWLDARNQAILAVEHMMANHLHKQIANRVLEPWMHIEVVVTSAQWANFYALRDHAMAQPEMKALAGAMLEVHQASTPKRLEYGEWHLPFVFENLVDGPKEDGLYWPKISSARCARVSYLRHDGKVPDPAEDLALYDRLMGGDVVHASPTEHQAQAVDDAEICLYLSNFGEVGWAQFRKFIRNENVKNYKGFQP